jgi:hypothetical protein
MNTGAKVAVGVGVWLFIRHWGKNIVNQRVFSAALASNSVLEIREAEAFLRAQGDKVGADTLDARADYLEKVK